MRGTKKFRKGENYMKLKETLRRKTKGKKGFTLVELVIVIAVLAIIAAIAIPTVTNVIGNANKAADASNAQAIELAIKTAQSEVAANNTNKSDNAQKLIDNKNGKIEDILTTYGVDLTSVGLGSGDKGADALKEGASFHYYYTPSTGKVYAATTATDKNDIQLTKNATTYSIDANNNVLTISAPAQKT